MVSVVQSLRSRLGMALWHLAIRFEKPLRKARAALRRLLVHLSRVLRALPGSSRTFGPPRRFTWNTHDWAAQRGVLEATIDEPTRCARTPVQAEGQAVPHTFSDSVDWLLPPTFVVRLPHARVWGPDAVVIAEDDTFLADQANALQLQAEAMPVMRTARLGMPEKLRGVTATITSGYSESYYHWMFDLLPRLALLERAGIRFDHLLAPAATRFQRETLAAAGIGSDVLVEYRPTSYFDCETLVMPSMPGTPGQSPLWAIDYLRGLFREHIEGQRKTRRLYVSRADTNRRKLANEDELRTALEPYGFEWINPGGLSVAQQAEMFAQAEVVVAPHGGALTNLVFAQRGAKVVELFPPGYTPVCFWTICTGADLDYRPVFDDATEPFDGVSQWQPYHVKPVRVLDMLARMNVQPR